ncbi:MAG: LptF/LptG family permease [Thainema sp.]
MTDFSTPRQRWQTPRWASFGISVMDRYLAAELLAPFLFGVGAFTSIGVSVDSLFELIRRVTESGLPFSLAVEIFLLKMPEFVVLAFPMSTLLATLMTFGRLSSDSELVAMRGCGVSIYRIVAPAIVLSFIVTGMTFAFNELITPAASYRAAITLERALNEERPPFQEENILYQEFRDSQEGGEELSRLFYARRFDGAEMKGLTILDLSQDGLNQIVSAKSATWDLSQNAWNFEDGTIYVVSPDGSFRNIVTFENQTLQLPRTPLDLAERGRDYGEMNIAQSQDLLRLLENSGAEEQKIRKLKVRIQQKYALPFVCAVMGTVGAALGIRSSRNSGRATSFGVSVVIIFAYYLFAYITNAMGITGAVSPFMSAWIPNIFGLVVGVLLLMRASR